MENELNFIHIGKKFHKNFSYSRTYADSEADSEIDNSIKRNKTADVYKQNPLCKGSELNDVLQSCSYETPFGYNFVEWLGIETKEN